MWVTDKWDPYNWYEVLKEQLGCDPPSIAPFFLEPVHEQGALCGEQCISWVAEGEARRVQPARKTRWKFKRLSDGHV